MEILESHPRLGPTLRLGIDARSRNRIETGPESKRERRLGVFGACGSKNVALGFAALRTPSIHGGLILKQKHHRAGEERIVPSVHHLDREVHHIISVEDPVILDPDCHLTSRE